MAARTKKKTAPRKSAASSGGRRFVSVGWLATAAVAGAWAISDGRPVQHVTSLAEEARTKIAGFAKNDRIASLIEDEPEPSPVRRRVTEHHPPASEIERTGSIRPAAPRPAPLQVAAIPRPTAPVPLHDPQPKIAVAVPSSAPLLPFAQPRTEASLARPATMPATAIAPTAAPSVARPGSGGERHATRQLAIHAAPDGASPRLSAVESGASVLVLRSAGAWRYVRNPRSNAEGWVDGRYLAGEATADASR